MGDRGDQLGVAAFGAAPGLGAAQRDHHPAYGTGRVLAYIPCGDQDLAAAGQQQIALGLADPDGEAAVRIGQRPPAAALEVLQRQDVLQGAAESGGPGHGGDPGGGGVEADDPAGLVGDDQAVGEVVGIDGGVDGSGVPTSDVPAVDVPAVRMRAVGVLTVGGFVRRAGAVTGAHRGRACPARHAHADSHIPYPTSRTGVVGPRVRHPTSRR